jgi:ADP-heptose:LPS heptosyltransferase
MWESANVKRGKPSNRPLDFYIGIPILNVLATFRGRRTLPAQTERIGILGNPALGDTLLLSGAVQDIRQRFPSSRLIFFSGKPNAAAKLLPEIDELQIIPVTRPWEAIREMRSARLDLLIDFTSWQRVTALMSLYSGARCVVGFQRRGQFRHRGYDATIEHRGDCHELENMRRMTRFLGVEEHAAPALKLPEAGSAMSNPASARRIVFHPWASGSLRHLREWPEDRWVELALRLNNVGRVFVLTGGPGDRERCERLKRKLEAAGVCSEIVTGSSGLEEVATALLVAELLVSVNTGVMHLGAILGVATVALNGPNSEHRWGPVGPRVMNVPTADGSGGFLDLGFEFKGRNVMERITVQATVDAAELLLRAKEGLQAAQPVNLE